MALDEFGLIRMMVGQKGTVTPRSDVIVGVGDDAAIVAPTPGMRLVLTVDTMTEEMHFNRYTMRDEDIGWKAMAASVSDLAAMGAVPRWALVSVSAPRADGMPERLAGMYRGLYACAEACGVEVIGGDTTSSAAGLTASVTAVGEVEPEHMLLRSKAKPGDAVFVTGPLGASAAGLHAMTALQVPAEEAEAAAGEPLAPLLRAHRRPVPRIGAGRLLGGCGYAAALNDISDGLASESWEIAEASGVRVQLRARDIPFLPEVAAYAAAAGKEPIDWALNGGEDYELVGTVPAERASELEALFGSKGLPIYWVGTVLEGSGVTLESGSGETVLLGKRGFNHFA